MKKIKLAIIGQGRSGRDIHGAFFRGEKNVKYDVVAIVELDEARRELATKEYPGATILDDYTKLYDMDVDLVVNATYSNDHYAITKELLSNKMNVVVEKPMARNRYECDDLIKCAKDNGVLLAVFQQTFLAPYYMRAIEVCKSGILGDILQVNITYNGLVRRWDWQTLQCKMAGSIFNTGPHPIGMALGFLDFDENAYVAYSRRNTVITSGDGEDYAKIIMTAPGKATVDIEMISTDAFPEDIVKIIGTRGTYKTSMSKYVMKYIVDGENPERPVIYESLKTEEGLPAYCSETLITHEEEGDIVGSSFDMAVENFYDMIYDKMINDIPLTVTPEIASRVIGVIETVHATNPLPVLYN